MNPVEFKTEQTVDAQVFEKIQPCIEIWDQGKGKRLYKLDEGLDGSDAIYALSEYTKEIDSSTGDVIEEEHIKKLGSITPIIHISQDSGRIFKSMSKLGAEQAFKYWNEAAVEQMMHRFVIHTCELVKEHITNEVPSNICPRTENLHIPFEPNDEFNKLSKKTEYNEIEWSLFFDFLSNETLTITDDNEYTVQTKYNTVPEWRLDAIEYRICGIFNSIPLSQVAALLEWTDVSTQSEIAAILDKSESTISEQISQVKDMRERLMWECERLIN